MTQQFAHRLTFAISLVCQFSICLGKEAPDPADPNRYLNAVREFGDNVLKYGRDTYGPKHTPLFVDGLNVNTHEPVKWIAPNGDRWILSNLASQQNLFRTLDGLTKITGDPKYKQAAMDAIKYAFENLRSPNGLLYWGGHVAYDAGADRIYGNDIHELKTHFPYYELMWQVDPDASKRFIDAFWSGHISDWSNLDMDRHCYGMSAVLEEPWKHEYEDGPVFFIGTGLPFDVTGCDLYYAAVMLSKLSGQNDPLIWAKRLAFRYVETRDRKTGISSYIYSLPKNTSPHPLAEDFKGHTVNEGSFFFEPAFGDLLFRQFSIGGDTFSPGIFGNTAFCPWISQLILSYMLGAQGKEFQQWALEELTAWGKTAYRKQDNSWIPMFRDGTSLEGYVIRRGTSSWPRGTIFRTWQASFTDFWAYALAYRTTGDEFMWDMARNIAQGIDFGDIGVDSKEGSQLNIITDCSNSQALLGFLSLYEKTRERQFLDMAKRIGDNILTQRFHKGLFVPSSRHVYAKLDAIESLVLLHLYAAFSPNDPSPPMLWPSRINFFAPYRGKDEMSDSDLIYNLVDLAESPISLNEAAAGGNLELVKSLIAKGANVNNIERGEGTFKNPLHDAVKFNHRDIVELLLSKGADVKARGGWRDDTPMHYAAALRYGKDIIELLLAKGADINAMNGYGDTPLQYAAYNDLKDIIELLLQKGATIANLHVASYMRDLEKMEAFIKEGTDMNALDSHGYASLHYAARNNQKEAVELLISKGADVNVKNWSVQTPLDVALSNNQKDIVELLLSKGAALSIHTAARMGDIERVRSMIEKGVDINAKDKNGLTALFHAVNGGHKELVELFLAKGADIDAKDSRNRTPFYYAIIAARTDIAKLLIAKGFDISAKDSFGYTPLHWALIMGNQELAEFILAQGVDVNAKDKRGWAPLHYAARNGTKELSELLIAKGADINAKNNSGETPLDAAVFTNANPVVDLLIAKGAESSTLNVAAYRGDLDKIRAALKDGADVNSKNSQGETLLYSAALEGRKDIVEFLIIQGADINSKNSQAKTALHAAAVGGHKDVVELLIAKGVDINVLSSMNQTPLYLAVSNKHKEVVELLLAKGADINIKDWQGQTALQIAEKIGNAEITELLRKYEAKKKAEGTSTTNTPQGTPKEDKDVKNTPADPNESKATETAPK
jgi:pectate lyase